MASHSAKGGGASCCTLRSMHLSQSPTGTFGGGNSGEVTEVTERIGPPADPRADPGEWDAPGPVRSAHRSHQEGLQGCSSLRTALRSGRCTGLDPVKAFTHAFGIPASGRREVLAL